MFAIIHGLFAFGWLIWLQLNSHNYEMIATVAWTECLKCGIRSLKDLIFLTVKIKSSQMSVMCQLLAAGRTRAPRIIRLLGM